jgi:hypothetical protein
MVEHVICPVDGDQSQHHVVRLCNNETAQSYLFSQKDGVALKLEETALSCVITREVWSVLQMFVRCDVLQSSGQDIAICLVTFPKSAVSAFVLR